MRPANLAEFIADRTSVSLRGFRLGPAGAQQLTRTRAMLQVTYLDLEGNAIGDEGLRMLLGSVVTRNVVDLGLCDNQLSGAAIGELATCKLAGKLSSLDVSNNGLGPDDVAALLPALAGVGELDLAENPIGDAGAALLAPALAEVGILRLSWCGIGPRGLAALLAGPLPRDASVMLGHNPLGDEGVAALVRSERRPSSLGLEYCGITAAGLAQLVEGGYVGPTAWIDLCGNPIDDVACLHGRTFDCVQLCATPLRQPTIAKLRASVKGRIVASAPVAASHYLACPYCRTEVDEQVPRCRGCGRDWTRDALVEERRGRDNVSQVCPHCEAGNDPFASACRACGSWLPRGDVAIAR